jgi:gamma-glutamyltranspeptidase/glutathione hydrolase
MVFSRRDRFAPSFLSFVLAVLCFSPLRAQDPPPFQLQVDYSPYGMVAAGQPLATWAGVQILEAGGNAADAAVAAAFAIAVVEPTMNSIGGRTQILIRLPSGEIKGIDATTQAPMTYDPATAPQASYGYAVVGVPGAVAGLVRLQSEFGTLPLETVMAPALRYARNGFRILPGDARRQASGAEQAAEFEGTRKYYLKADGSPYEAGDLLVQEDLGNTLELIAKTDGEAFYRGSIAEAMAEDLQANGSAVTLESLRDYVAEDGQIVRGSYRGFDLAGMFIPTAGAVAVEALQILENFDLASMDLAERTALVGEALRLAIIDFRSEGVDQRADELTSKAWAATRAQEVTLGEPVGVGDETLYHLEGSHTTHLSTADKEGMMVALTQTLGPNMGSKVVTPGLGFLYASTLGGYLGDMQPGERARSFICPFILEKDGEPVMVLGAAGGGMIPIAVVNAIVHYVDGGLPFPQAVAAPRIAPAGVGFTMETHTGAGWSDGMLDAVRGLGLEIRETPREAAFGRIHGISFDSRTGNWVGVADPDWEGSALGARRAGGGGQ